ncbi:MAG: hypothetical protein IPL46_24085 [Saprospiraceae bacterium]|nr:hypothetical protein [Saprospiraceae bacterium]
MKLLTVFIIWIFLTLLLSFLGHWVLGFAGAFLIVPVFRLQLATSILIGFCAGLFSWIGFAWFVDHANLGQLSGMIGSLLQIKSTFIILGITGFLGGLGVAITAWLAARVFLTDSSQKVVS